MMIVIVLRSLVSYSTMEQESTYKAKMEICHYKSVEVQELKVVLRISLDKGKSMNKVLFYFILLTTSY
jgi:hypothetical protein